MPLIVSKSDNSHVDVNGQPNNPFAYIWVLWEDGTIDAPGRGKKDIHNFRNSYSQTYDAREAACERQSKIHSTSMRYSTIKLRSVFLKIPG